MSSDRSPGGRMPAMREGGGPTTRVLVEADPELPLVHACVSTLTGASEDPPGLEGLTRLCTRLMRRTAGGRMADEIDADIDRMGATFGIDCGHSSTSLSGSVLVRSFGPFLELVEQAMISPGFSADELERLKRETLAELIEVFDSDQHLVQRWFQRALFEGHAYGQTVVGNPQSLERIGVTDVAACHRVRFCQGQMLFGFAGDIDPTRCRELSEALHARLPVAERSPAELAEPAVRPGRHLWFVDKPDRSQTQILIGGLGSHPADEDHFPLLVANSVFGGTFTSRLTQEVRGKRGWSYGAYSSLGYDRRRQAFSMWTFPKASDAAACIELELSLLQDWCESGITEEELSGAQRYLVQSRAFSCDTTSKRIGLVMDEVLGDLPSGYHERYVDGVGAVTLEQANAAVRKRISIQDLTIAVVGTHSEIGADVARAIDGLSSERVVPFDTD